MRGYLSAQVNTKDDLSSWDEINSKEGVLEIQKRKKGKCWTEGVSVEDNQVNKNYSLINQA